MKKITLIAITLVGFLFYSCGTTNSIPVHIDSTSSIVELNQPQNDLFVKANNWMVENFNNAKSVIQFADKEAGVVTGKYLLRSTYEYSGYTATEKDVYAIINIQLRDNAGRITVTPDDFRALTSDLIAQTYRFNEQDVRIQIQDLIASFEDYMKNDNSSDW